MIKTNGIYPNTTAPSLPSSKGSATTRISLSLSEGENRRVVEVAVLTNQTVFSSIKAIFLSWLGYYKEVKVELSGQGVLNDRVWVNLSSFAKRMGISLTEYLNPIAKAAKQAAVEENRAALDIAKPIEQPAVDEHSAAANEKHQVISSRHLIKQFKTCTKQDLSDEEANLILELAKKGLIESHPNGKISRKHIKGLSRSLLFVEGKCYLLTTTKKNDKTLGEGSFKKAKYAILLNPDNPEQDSTVVIGAVSKKKTKPSDLELIRKENDIMKTVDGSSASIVRSYGSFESATKSYLIMEHCQKGDLFDQLGKLSIDDKLLYAKNILEGVSDLHKEGIYHRDIKPENVFVTNTQAKIGDLGLSTAADSDQLLLMAGTKTYMSPDYMLAHKSKKGVLAATIRLDAWSTGLTLLLLFQRRPQHLPFQGIGQFDELFRYLITQRNSVENQIYSAIQNLPSEVPSEICTVIQNLLQYDPSKRWTPKKALDYLSAEL